MTEIVLKEDEKNSQRAVKRKRIRRLVDLNVPEERRKRFRRNTDAEISKTKMLSKRVLVTCVLIVIALAILIRAFESEYGLIRKFVQNYQEHYHQIVHNNRHYCRDKVDIDNLFREIRKGKKILHQDKALEEIQTSLNERPGHPIALVGPVGVGKRLFVHSFLNLFPFPWNVYSYVWAPLEHCERMMYYHINGCILKFSDCGTNLLIVKNLKPADIKVAEKVVKMIYKIHYKNPKRQIVFFVFNLNTMLNETEYLEQHESLQNLDFAATVNFRSFKEKELEDCIRLELKQEDKTLSSDKFEELRETIDVKRSGCKHVNAKVMAFGKKVHDPITMDIE